MSSKKYIVSKINELAKHFPYVKFSYQMDELSETHFIEVLPKDIFEQYDSRFVKEQNDIIVDFIKIYPSEGLAFITEDDLFTVGQPEYIKCGSKYHTNTISLSWNDENLDIMLEDFVPEIPTSVVFKQDIYEVKQYSKVFNFSFKLRNHNNDFESPTFNLHSKSVNAQDCTIDEVENEPDYSLAA
jgi:hypothetical protein